MTDNVLKGQENQLQVILNVQDEHLRNTRLENLKEAFFQDITRMNQPILLILDTFNDAPESLQRWIEGSFLAEVADTPSVYVVVAGQQVPQPTGEWLRYAHHCMLEAILDQDAWYKYAKDVGLPFNRDEVAMAVRILKGLPAEIVKTFETLARELSS